MGMREILQGCSAVFGIPMEWREPSMLCHLSIHSGRCTMQDWGWGPQLRREVLVPEVGRKFIRHTFIAYPQEYPQNTFMAYPQEYPQNTPLRQDCL